MHNQNNIKNKFSRVCSALLCGKTRPILEAIAFFAVVAVCVAFPNAHTLIEVISTVLDITKFIKI
jgi:hypothetical protein